MPSWPLPLGKNSKDNNSLTTNFTAHFFPCLVVLRFSWHLLCEQPRSLMSICCSAILFDNSWCQTLGHLSGILNLWTQRVSYKGSWNWDWLMKTDTVNQQHPHRVSKRQTRTRCRLQAGQNPVPNDNNRDLEPACISLFLLRCAECFIESEKYSMRMQIS